MILFPAWVSSSFYFDLVALRLTSMLCNHNGPKFLQMARSKNVEELATDPQRHAFREAAAAAAERRLAQECTFCPDTSKPEVAGKAVVEPKAPFTVAGGDSGSIIERYVLYWLQVSWPIYRWHHYNMKTS